MRRQKTNKRITELSYRPNYSPICSAVNVEIVHCSTFDRTLHRGLAIESTHETDPTMSQSNFTSRQYGTGKKDGYYP